jgi:hypothetical protein
MLGVLHPDPKAESVLPQTQVQQTARSVSTDREHCGRVRPSGMPQRATKARRAASLPVLLSLSVYSMRVRQTHRSLP